MGVQGLWKLLESTGRPVSLESLEGKILAVDVSLWLHQAMRGMRDETGNISANAHLHVLFNRICKLLFYRIKPIFVFDGSVPEVKRQTMVARRQRRTIAAGKSKRTSEKIIKNYLQTRALHTVMGEAGGSTQENTAPSFRIPASNKSDLYELPPIPPAVLQDSDSDDEPTVDDLIHHYQNLEDVDIDSESFKSLPPEIQHEVIVEMKEVRKKNSWKHIDHLPRKSQDFSKYQMQKLLQKGKMTKRIDDLRNEMGKRNAGAIASMLDIEGGSAPTMEAGRIISEDARHYLLVKRNSSKTDGDDAMKTTNENVLSEEEEDTNVKLSTIQEVDEDDLEVKGQEKGQRSLDIPQEPNVIVVDDAETKTSRAAEISQIVKNFFSGKQTNSGVVEMQGMDNHGIKTSQDVIVLDHVKGQWSGGDDVEVIEIRNRERLVSSKMNQYDNNDEIIIVDEDDDNQKNADFKTIQVISQSDVISLDDDDDDEVAILRETVIMRTSPVVKVDVVMKPDASFSQVVTEQINSSPVSMLDDESKDVSLVAKGDAERTDTSPVAIVDERMKNTSVAKVDAGITDVDDEEVMELSGQSSDDDDFIEVILEPSGVRMQEDELFPASTFIPSADVSDVPFTASSPSKETDIQQQKSHVATRVDVNVCAMDTEDLVTEKDTRMEAGDSDDGMDDADIAEDDDEEEEEEEDIEMEMEMETLREAAKKEWEAMNVEDVSSLQENLATERGMLQIERGKQDRVAASVTDLMYTESKELLSLFGIPYVVSPEEAEAQCAYLDMTEQTQGTITDDSDIWLLGGRSVYRNVFTKGKDVECFKMVNVANQLVLDRCKFIVLAMLLGSDYTEGVAGVGGVTAMEILTEFPGEGIELLKAFKAWWEVAHKQLMPPVESQLKKKLRKLTLPSSFPSQRVLDAYWNPVVDESMEKFSWQSPDLDLLREFAREKLGWTRSKSDETLLPVIKRLHEKTYQSKIGAFFNLERQEPCKVTSKRLKRVLKRLRNPEEAKKEEEEGEKMKVKKGRKKKDVVAMEIKSKKRKTRKNNDRTLEDNETIRDTISMVTDTDKKRTNKSDCEGIKKDGKDDDSVSSGDSESSEEEYILPKKIKIDAEETASTRMRRSRRTSEEKIIYKEDVPIPSAEFLEIEEAMSRKTEGIESLQISQNKNGNAAFTFVSNFKSKVEIKEGNTGEMFAISEQRADETNSSQLSGLKEGGATKRSTNQGSQRGGKGQRGKGKGHAGSKGKGKAKAGVKNWVQRGPQLSESSSDSDG